MTANTVLAAHLRAKSLPAHGEPWEAAKRVLADAGDFQAAVRVAEGVMRPAAVTVRQTGIEAPRRAVPVQRQAFDGVMDWFPKPFRPGDIDGLGARRLLGTPNLEPTTLLVREMAQNSWDARGAAQAIRFTLNLRKIEGEALRVLREKVFTGEALGLNLRALLERDSIWCLEVSDRGTVGLNGPIRNDLAVEPGIDRNFVDLVFNIGAPRDTHLGGGTYGFGKTISYVISNVGTVLIWSRSETVGGYEERLIGSAMGDAFNLAGGRYTGRHWWGHVVDNGERPEPIIGDKASALATRVFQDRFGGEETGTSFLILDPDLTGETPGEKVEALRTAVLENLWPKLMESESGRSAMQIGIFLDGNPVEMPSPEDDPRWAWYSASLRAVRAAQAANASPSAYSEPFVRVYPIESQRPKKLLGHLALTRRPVEFGQEPEHHVALMRHQAELVVKKQEYRALEVPGFHWMGVFKPVEDVDDAFAEAEPPAHDDWVPNGVKDKGKASIVRVAQRRIKETVDSFLMPSAVEAGKGEVVSSVAHVGDLLADMVGTVHGSGPSLRRMSGKTKSAPKPKDRSGLEITGVVYGSDDESGWEVTTLQVKVDWSGNADELIDLRFPVGTEGTSQKDDDVVGVDGWGRTASGPWNPEALRPEASGIHYYRFRHKPGLAIDVRPRVTTDAPTTDEEA